MMTPTPTRHGEGGERQEAGIIGSLPSGEGERE
jgi:hypothetical protein